MKITNFLKTPEDIIVDLINFDNDTNLHPELLIFGKPKVIETKFNTSLVLTSVPDSHYVGSVTYKYDRIDIARIPEIQGVTDLLSTKFEIGDATKISDLIPAINSKFRINLTPNDYIDAPLPGFESTDPSSSPFFGLVTSPDSLIYINQLLLSIIRDGNPLSGLILKTILDGINYDLETKTLSIDSFINLLNLENPSEYPFTSEDVTFSDPVTVFDADGRWNTKVTVSSINGSGYIGFVDVFYNRPSLLELDSDSIYDMISEYPFTPQIVLDILNSSRGTNFNTSDVEILSLPLMNIGEVTPITVTMKQSSLEWTGAIEIYGLYGIPTNTDILHYLLNTRYPTNDYFTIP